MHTLIASRQTLVVSASTLYESELQYSVGGAGIGYPAGGSSTHMHTHIYTCMHFCIILVGTLGDEIQFYTFTSEDHRDIYCEGLKAKLILE